MAKEIPLTKGHIAIVDDEDYPLLAQWKWSYSQGYAVRKVKTETGTKTYAMHSQLLTTACDSIVDHINGNRLDNRRHNLRPCAHLQNNMNRRPNLNKLSNPFKGVYKHKRRKANPWQAMIGYQGTRIHLGVFPTATEAAKAYNAAALHYYGEYAWLNQVD